MLVRDLAFTGRVYAFLKGKQHSSLGKSVTPLYLSVFYCGHIGVVIEWRRIAGDRHMLGKGFRRTRVSSSYCVKCHKLPWETCMVQKADANI